MNRPIYIAIFGLSLICNHALSQHLEKKISGKIYDAQTFESIPFVNVVTSKSGSFSNLDGVFAIIVSPKDTLYFSHVNYNLHFISPTDIDNDSLFIFLSPKDIFLNEVIIHELPPEEIFKDNILDIKPQPTKEEVNAKINVSNAQKLVQAGFTPDMNSEDNYNAYIQGPQGVSILSTHPSKGLLKAIRNISRYKTLTKSYQIIPFRNATDSLWIDLNSIGSISESDTLTNDQPLKDSSN